MANCRPHVSRVCFRSPDPSVCNSVAAQTTKITHIELIFGSLMIRVTTLETSAASGSSSLVSARSRNIFGQNNGYTAAGSLGSHGPESSDDNRNTRRRLDTISSLEDEQARRAVILRFPCEQFHNKVTNWINNIREIQHISLLETHQNSLQNKWPIRQTRI